MADGQAPGATGGIEAGAMPGPSPEVQAPMSADQAADRIEALQREVAAKATQTAKAEGPEAALGELAGQPAEETGTDAAVRTGTEPGQAQNAEEAQRIINEISKDQAALLQKGPTELTSERQAEQARLDYLSQEHQRNPSEQLKAEINNSQDRLSRIEGFQQQKTAAEQTQQAGATQKDLDAARRADMTPTQLRAKISEGTSKIGEIGNAIGQKQEQLKTANEADANRLRAEIGQLQNEELGLRQERDLDRQAQGKAGEQARGQSSLEGTRNLDTIRNVPKAEYDKMTMQERANYLSEVARNMDNASEDDIGRVEEAIKRGERLGITEMASYSKYLTETLLTKGRRAIDMESLTLLQQRYPEMVNAVLDQVVQTREGTRRFNELFKSDWKKVLEAAKKTNLVLALLLLLIAGGAILVSNSLKPPEGIKLTQ